MPLPVKLLHRIGSVKITVYLLVISMLVVFVGTLAQRHIGLWQLIDQYFTWHKPLVWVRLEHVLPAGIQPTYENLAFPLPSGFLLGSLLAINLLAAFTIKFPPLSLQRHPKRLALGLLLLAAGGALVSIGHWHPTWRTALASNVVSMLVGGALLYLPLTLACCLIWRKGGLAMSHLAILLLLIGEGLTRTQARESHISLLPGQSASYSEDYRYFELAVIRPLSDGSRRVEAIPQSRLQRSLIRHQPIVLPESNITIQIDTWFKNSQLQLANDNSNEPISKSLSFAPPANAPALAGRRLVAEEVAPVSGTSGNGVNIPSLTLTLKQDADVQPLAVSGLLTEERQIDTPQGPLFLSLRPTRYPLPFKLTLNAFHQKFHPGTMTPSRYASEVQVLEPGQAPRPVVIEMNQPLRSHNLAVFQSSVFKKGTSNGSILQVVSNQSWAIPYIACAMGSIGLLIHFSQSLIAYLRRRR